MKKEDKVIIETIRNFIKTYGYSPSYSELRNRTKYSSLDGIRKRVLQLKEMGYLDVSPNVSRSIRLKK